MSENDLNDVARNSVFLERASYRRRRLHDLARILPILGLILVMLPLLWPRDGTGTMSDAVLYLFGVWMVLIIISAILARSLRQPETAADPSKEA